MENFRSGFVEESFLRNDDVGDERSREIFSSAYSLSFLKTNFYHSYLPSNCIFCSFFFSLLFTCFRLAFNYFTPSLTFFFDKSVMSMLVIQRISNSPLNE